MNDSSDNILIGVDGGGSGCRAAVARRDGPVLGEGSGGPSNIASDFSSALANIEAALKDAVAQAGLTLPDVADAPAHVGLAGVMTPADAARVADALPLTRATVTDDRPTTLVGALGPGDGVVMAIGTGSFIGASRGGDLSFVGGWGFHVSDQASGAWLGRAALDRCLQCQDGLIAPGGLTRALMARFDDDPNAIVAFSFTASPADYAALAPAVVKAAREGDPLGRELMQAGAAYLSRALDRLGWHPGLRICLTGGLGPSYRDWLGPAGADVVPPRGTALEGALRLAGWVPEREKGLAP